MNEQQRQQYRVAQDWRMWFGPGGMPEDPLSMTLAYMTDTVFEEFAESAQTAEERSRLEMLFARIPTDERVVAREHRNSLPSILGRPVRNTFIRMDSLWHLLMAAFRYMDLVCTPLGLDPARRVVHVEYVPDPNVANMTVDAFLENAGVETDSIFPSTYFAFWHKGVQQARAPGEEGLRGVSSLTQEQLAETSIPPRRMEDFAGHQLGSRLYSHAEVGSVSDSVLRELAAIYPSLMVPIGRFAFDRNTTVWVQFNHYLSQKTVAELQRLEGWAMDSLFPASVRILSFAPSTPANFAEHAKLAMQTFSPNVLTFSSRPMQGATEALGRVIKAQKWTFWRFHLVGWFSDETCQSSVLERIYRAPSPPAPPDGAVDEALYDDDFNSLAWADYVDQTMQTGLQTYLEKLLQPRTNLRQPPSQQWGRREVGDSNDQPCRVDLRNVSLNFAPMVVFMGTHADRIAVAESTSFAYNLKELELTRKFAKSKALYCTFVDFEGAETLGVLVPNPRSSYKIGPAIVLRHCAVVAPEKRTEENGVSWFEARALPGAGERSLGVPPLSISDTRLYQRLDEHDYIETLEVFSSDHLAGITSAKFLEGYIEHRLKTPTTSKTVLEMTAFQETDSVEPARANLRDFQRFVGPVVNCLTVEFSNGVEFTRFVDATMRLSGEGIYLFQAINTVRIVPPTLRLGTGSVDAIKNCMRRLSPQMTRPGYLSETQFELLVV